MRLNKTFILSGNEEKLDKSNILAINRDLENAFTALQTLDARPRTVDSDPKHATPASRPNGNRTGEIVYYSGKLYFCTNTSTPTWELITST
jgi:hypothetical protein